MNRSLALLVLLCAAGCSEPETPLILDGTRGACGSVVEGASPGDVECPTDCPIAVQAFRVRDTDTCERSSARYVACIRAGGTGTPGAAVLVTEDGPIFVDDPAFDCSGEDGCAGVGTTTTDRWETCAGTDEAGCECVCQGGECAYDRFLSQIGGCGLPSPCAPLTADSEITEEVLQCYMDTLSQGGPALIEIDAPAVNDVTGETSTSRTVLAVASRDVVRLERLSYDQPASACDLQSANFFLTCDPGDPTDVNVENAEGLIERVPCTDPRAWIANCDAGEPVCPS